MKKRLRFDIKFFIAAIVIFIIECLIAFFLHDPIIRPYVGDFLVVIFLYCLVKSFIDIPAIPLAPGILLFAYLIETLQYFSFIDRIGLRHSKLANIILGNRFEWIDMIAYTLGIALIIFWETRRRPASGKN